MGVWRAVPEASAMDAYCVKCPPHSYSHQDKASECVCERGFYRAETDPRSMACTILQWSEDAVPQDAVSWVVWVGGRFSPAVTLTPPPPCQCHCSAENDPPPTYYLLCGGPVGVLTIEEQGNTVHRETDGLQSGPVHLQSVLYGPPSAPGNPISTVNETAVTLEWSPPRDSGGRGDVTYSVHCKKCSGEAASGTGERCVPCGSGPHFNPRQFGLAHPRVLVTELQPRTNYTFSIEALNGVSDLSPSPRHLVSVNVTTSQMVSVIVKERRSRDSITLAWQAPEPSDGVVVEYEVTYYEKNQRDQNYTVLKTKSNSMTVEGLKPGTTYVFRVRARTDGGYGNYGGEIELETSHEVQHHRQTAAPCRTTRTQTVTTPVLNTTSPSPKTAVVSYQNGSGSSSVTSPALVLVETPNESVCGGTVVSTEMNDMLAVGDPNQQTILAVSIAGGVVLLILLVACFVVSGRTTDCGTKKAPTVPPHTDSLGVSTKTKAGLVTEDDPLPF
ncbi:hypothetical protein NFI96_005642 [Prochilodus magdalenae]|nr:hypothetical protein NFI96_005642 [Prochilodus magdalenae]